MESVDIDDHLDGGFRSPYLVLSRDRPRPIGPCPGGLCVSRSLDSCHTSYLQSSACCARDTINYIAAEHHLDASAQRHTLWLCTLGLLLALAVLLVGGILFHAWFLASLGAFMCVVAFGCGCGGWQVFGQDLVSGALPDVAAIIDVQADTVHVYQSQQPGCIMDTCNRRNWRQDLYYGPLHDVCSVQLVQAELDDHVHVDLYLAPSDDAHYELHHLEQVDVHDYDERATARLRLVDTARLPPSLNIAQAREQVSSLLLLLPT